MIIGVFASKLKTRQVFTVEPHTSISRNHWALHYSHKHPMLAGQTQKTPATKTENTYTIVHHDTGKGTVPVAKRSPTSACKAQSISLDSRLT